MVRDFIRGTERQTLFVKLPAFSLPPVDIFRNDSETAMHAAAEKPPITSAHREIGNQYA